MEDDDSGSYLQADKFIRLLREEIQVSVKFVSENKASDIESYRHTTGKIMGMKKALEMFINKKK